MRTVARLFGIMLLIEFTVLLASAATTNPPPVLRIQSQQVNPKSVHYFAEPPSVNLVFKYTDGFPQGIEEFCRTNGTRYVAVEVDGKRVSQHVNVDMHGGPKPGLLLIFETREEAELCKSHLQHEEPQKPD